MKKVTWYIASIISAFSLSGMLFCFQFLQKRYPVSVYLFYVWLGSALFFGFYFIGSPITIKIIALTILILAGIASWIGNYSYNVAIGIQSNLGFVEAASSIRLPLLYVASLSLFDGQIDILRLIALGTMIIGIYLVSGRTGGGNNLVTKRSWLMWAILSGTMFAFLAIATRFANEQGISSNQSLFVVMFVGAIFYGTSAIFGKESLKLNKGLGVLILALIAAIIGNASLFWAFNNANNLAYPTIISNSRVVILYLISIIINHKRVDVKGAIGIFLTFISIIFLN